MPGEKSDDRPQQAETTAGTSGGGDIPVRERGGFRQLDLRTKPENVINVRATDLKNTRPCDLLCNYVKITPRAEGKVYMYRVDFQPLVESDSLMRRLFRLSSEKVFSGRPIYDGYHECRSSQQLNDKTTSVEVPHPTDTNTIYKITFTNTGTVTHGLETLRMYNSQMKQFLRILGYYQPQPGLYIHPNQSQPVGPDIMLLRGYRTAASIHDGDAMLMNLEAGHKLVQTKNVLEIMQFIRNNRRGGDLQESLRSELVGKLVVTSYNKRVYRIEDIDFANRPTSTFKGRGDRDISFVDYYKDAYGKNIASMDQPLLLVVPNNQRRRDEGDTRETKLVPELCNIAGLTEQQRTDNRLKLDLIRASQVPPDQRVEHCMQFLQAFQSNPEIKKALEVWGYSYDTNLVRLKGHTYAPTCIAFGATCAKQLSDWTRADPVSAEVNITGLAVAPKLKELAILIARNDSQAKDEIFAKLKQGFTRVGLIADHVTTVNMSEGNHPSAYINHLRALHPDTTAAIVILSRQDKERYDSVKKMASVERGLITQVVTSRLMTDQRKSAGASVKIAIQLAAKLGGEPWWVDLPIRNAMICGYDTYHDTTKRGRSYGAFLASLNDKYSRWYSKADAHDRMDEMSTQISENVVSAFNAYHKMHNRYPGMVFIYRDGVGEGQLEHVYKVELKQIREKVKSISEEIRLTMIIVNKRIGARFYVQNQEGFANPPPGTVIDHSVTRQGRYDFYLISQSTRHGTITPTYYNIIHDESGIIPQNHQKMAYKLCLLYYNWSGTVRVPAPCQYAHKLAQLCGEHLHAPPHVALSDRLHFL